MDLSQSFPSLILAMLYVRWALRGLHEYNEVTRGEITWEKEIGADHCLKVLNIIIIRFFIELYIQVGAPNSRQFVLGK